MATLWGAASLFISCRLHAEPAGTVIELRSKAMSRLMMVTSAVAGSTDGVVPSLGELHAVATRPMTTQASATGRRAAERRTRAAVASLRLVKSRFDW